MPHLVNGRRTSEAVTPATLKETRSARSPAKLYESSQYFFVRVTDGIEEVPLAASNPNATGPVNIERPEITGVAFPGKILSVQPGVWAGTGTITLTYQWRVGTSTVPGAVGREYLLRTQDANKAVYADITATDSAGSRTYRLSGGTVGSSREPPPTFHLTDAGDLLFDGPDQLTLTG